MSVEHLTFDLDSILRELGPFGRFQRKIYTFFSIPFIFAAFFALSYVFTTGVVPHRCLIPECESQNSSEWISFAIPKRFNKTFEQCLRYNSTSMEASCTFDAFNRSDVIRCEEIVFETQEKTIQTEWNLICEENKWKLTIVGTLNVVGQFFCIPIIGIISDRFGRKIALIIGMLGGGIFGTLRAFSQSYPMFLLLEFLDTFCSSGGSNVAYVLSLEYLQPQHRSMGAMVFSIMYPVGMIFIALLANYLQNWRHLLLSLYVPTFIGFFYFWLIPESMRWLHSKGRLDEISKIVHSAAKMNKVELSKETLEMLKIPPRNLETEKVTKSESVLSIFKYKKMFFIVVNCSFCICVNSLVYFGLSLNSVTLAGNKYLNFILSSFVEFPSHVFGYFLLEKAGRRFSICFCTISAGICCVVTELIPTDELQWRFAFYLLGKLLITTSFTIIYVYAAEMFPTCMRNSLIGICSMAGRIGAVIAPQMPLLASFNPSLPLYLFGSLSLAAGITSLGFPETSNAKLPDTIEEVLNLGKQKMIKNSD
ncbi:organic cation transporter protein-like [Culicoides brevitarsis]|uniref:organic cation transporter protein-like n=1 Tax=Culicoides brevitarsis TaxID=469753 RepID=UPI00307B5150